MAKRNEQQGYSSIIFYSFAISFFILSIINVTYPLGNFRMTMLSIVAMLFSLQQLTETLEETENSVADLEKRLERQDGVLDMMTSQIEPLPKKKETTSWHFTKSQLIFAGAMIILIVGLVIDVPFQNNILANTVTVVSFSVIFCTMGVKERYLTELHQLNDELYECDQRIINILINRVATLENEKNISTELQLLSDKDREMNPNDGE